MTSPSTSSLQETGRVRAAARALPATCSWLPMNETASWGPYKQRMEETSFSSGLSKKVTLANDRTRELLDKAATFSEREGGDLEASFKQCVSALEGMAEGEGRRVRLHADDNTFFSFSLQRCNDEGIWTTIFNGGLVGHGITFDKTGVLSLLEGRTQEWSLHS